MSIRNSPLQPSEIRGVYTALITPMHRGDGLSDAIDYKKLYKLIDDQARAGISGFVLTGTTGQSPTLDPKEQIRFVGRAFDYIKTHHPQLQVIVGAGSNCTKEARDMSIAVEERIGHSTFLHVTGYYNRPPQEGLEAHYKVLAKALPNSNILIYNIPSRAIEVKPQTIKSIVEGTNNVVGAKEAFEKETPKKVEELVALVGSERFACLSGEDGEVAEVMRRGGKGVISASANIAPNYFVRIARAAMSGNFTEAQRLQEEISPLVAAMFIERNPVPLSMLFNSGMRLPLASVPKRLNEIRQAVDKFKPEDLGINWRDY